MPKLTDKTVAARLKKLSGWSRKGDGIQKQFTFAGFPDAIAFVVRLAFAAEAVDHHPDITVSYRRVMIRYSTHSEGGLTDKDFKGATATDVFAAAS